MASDSRVGESAATLWLTKCFRLIVAALEACGEKNLKTPPAGSSTSPPATASSTAADGKAAVQFALGAVLDGDVWGVTNYDVVALAEDLA